MKTHYIIPVFVPFAGCPNKCTFCNQTKISGVQKLPSGTEVQQQISDYLVTIPKDRPVTIEVAYYGGSFTGIPQALQRELLTPATRALEAGNIKHIRISTRADYINEEVLSFLKEYKVDIIELGVQSLEENVLKLTQRGHSPEEVVKAIELIKQGGFSLGIQLMVGLPGDKLASFLQTVKETIKLKPDFVRLYPTLVIQSTQLAEDYRQGCYEPLTLEEAVEFCKLALLEFRKSDIPVIRIGLQPTDEINSDLVLAGPFHPAMRELVEAAIMRDKINSAIQAIFNIEDEDADLKQREKRKIFLGINPKDHSIVRGQKNSNTEYFQEQFPNLQLEIYNDSSLERGEFSIK